MIDLDPLATGAFRALPELDEAWRGLVGGARLSAVEAAAPRLRDAIRASGTALAARTLDVASFPYPTRFAFGGASTAAVPYVWLQNRAMLVEFRDLTGVRRRLLANPSRPEGSRKAPYFRDLVAPVPTLLQPAFERALSEQAGPIPERLSAMGVAPESIDYITFDHLHVQEIGPLLGPGGLYPRARLLVTEAELAAAGGLHPLQRRWYVAFALEGVAPAWILPFSRDLLLGEGLALVRSPGHTEGNHTIVVSLPGGLVTISENGVAPECYAPHASRIAGLAAHAAHSGERYILNANTRERTLDQYTSMHLEAVLARPDDPACEFPRHFPSSELVRARLAPGVRPTFTWGAFDHGTVGA